MVLVVGATGLVGEQVCRLLRARGTSVRALVRETSAPEKTEALHGMGAEVAVGDLKDPRSLERACAGVRTVVSTASATLSRQVGDTLETVDHHGQLALVDAAEKAEVDHFVYISFRNNAALQFPLREAKTAVEERLRAGSMDYTILQASYFMEVWLSPALGFDYAHAKATVFGSGDAPVSWISSADVAQCAAGCVHEPSTRRKTIEIGGPEALSPHQVLACFEEAGWGPIEVTHVSEADLRALYDSAEDPLARTFAALQLQYALGDAIDVEPLLDLLPLTLCSVREYAGALRTAPAESA